MPTGTAGAIGSDDIAEIIRMQHKEEGSADKAQQKTRGINLNARKFGRPVKPIFEGKSVSEAMAGLEQDGLSDTDDVSITSVQNLETIPSVSEGPGLFGMLASFSRRSGSSKGSKGSDSNRVGELPNKAKLQQQADSLVVHTVDLRQSSGSTTTSETGSSDFGKRSLSLLDTRNVRKNQPTESGNQAQSTNDFPILSDPSKALFGDGNFFAAMDGDQPASTSRFPVESDDKSSGAITRVSSKKTQETRAKRGNVKPKRSSPDGGLVGPPDISPLPLDQVPAPMDVMSWMPIVAAGSTVQQRPQPITIDDSEHSLSSIAAKRRPLSKETLMAQELAKKAAGGIGGSHGSVHGNNGRIGGIEW